MGKKVLKSYKRPGRFYKLAVPEMLLALLLYYRSYISQEFIGYLFGLDDTQVCRFIRKLEPILAKAVAITKCKKLSKQEVKKLIGCYRTNPLNDPPKKQKRYYSGKKKCHTLKTEIRITTKGRIVNISKSLPGSIHDFAIFKQEPAPPTNYQLFVDAGYQGMHKLHQHVHVPYKSSKYKSLNRWEKKYNSVLSPIRIIVENVIAKLKSFRILSHRYRNNCKRYNVKFNIIAGLVNLKGGFCSP